jgi:hypothetical protein
MMKMQATGVRYMIVALVICSSRRTHRWRFGSTRREALTALASRTAMCDRSSHF